MGSFHISNPCYCLLVLVAIMAMGPNGAMSSSIVDILSQQDQFSFLVRAINALGLADTLGSGNKMLSDLLFHYTGVFFFVTIN